MAAISEIVRGGATRLAGALLANAAASAAASPGLGAETFAASNSAAFGREANIALWTHALTLGPALARQASRLPPPPRMQAMTIGLPTVLRQFSMAWLSSRACAGATAKRKERTVAPPTRAVMKCSLEKYTALKQALDAIKGGHSIRTSGGRKGNLTPSATCPGGFHPDAASGKISPPPKAMTRPRLSITTCVAS